jgi:hypothetical protein
MLKIFGGINMYSAYTMCRSIEKLFWLVLHHNSVISKQNKGWESTVNTRLPKLVGLIGTKLAFNKLALTIDFPDP